MKKKETDSKKKKIINSKKKPNKTTPVKKASQDNKTEKVANSKERFHIVGMCASAGGLEAFEQFFKTMPSDSGIAFILVPHLDPTHTSIMVDLIKRCTAMEVVEAKDGMQVKRNCIYVIPANMGISTAPHDEGIAEADRVDMGDKDRFLKISDFVEQILLDNYAPPCVIINQKCDILYVNGRTGKYLEPASGEAKMNVLEMAREGLKNHLQSAIDKCMSQNSDVVADNQWNIPRLRERLEEIIPQNSSFSDFEVEHDFQNLGRRSMVLNARRVDLSDGRGELILLAIEDRTDDKRVGGG